MRVAIANRHSQTQGYKDHQHVGLSGILTASIGQNAAPLQKEATAKWGGEITMAPFKLYASKAWGSMIAELALALCEAETELIEVEWQEGVGLVGGDLQKHNPLKQIPTLVLPSGEVMTESAAILLYLNDLYPEAGLAPAPTSPQRAFFLKTLMILASPVYATYTYGDVPERWVGVNEKSGPGKVLRETTDTHREAMLKRLDATIKGPFWLGETPSALDLYLWPMSFWRPGAKWMRENIPGIWEVIRALAKHPKLTAVGLRNGLIDADGKPRE